jgi:beta-lactamase regulating signal transducer with metallopeptidase domain
VNIDGFNAIASAAFERMVYSLAEGLLLTLVVAIALRLLPARASQTRFAVWLSALAGIVAVTLFGLHGASGVHEQSSSSLLTLPVAVAEGAFALWALLATLGLARIALGMCQLSKLRRQCTELNPRLLPAEARGLIQEFQGVRRVTILQANDAHTPKAVGFFAPAIILPKWLLEESTGEELKHVLLHELAHLRRRDDWTNLIQQVVKALFFFNPAVWWMERELALSREQACDDAALEQTADAKDYARSLALVAEKSFLRRQIALAQAVVGRAHQLTQRVTRILDPKRPVKNKTWRPAVPLVAMAAALCGFSASWTPDLVKIQDASLISANAQRSMTTASASAQAVAATPTATNQASAREVAGSVRLGNEGAAAVGVKAWPASLKFDQGAQQPRGKRNIAVPLSSQKLIARANVAGDRAGGAVTSLPQTKRTSPSPMVMAKHQTGTENPDGINRSLTQAVQIGDGLVMLVATQQTIVAGPDGWHVEVSQVRWVVPAKAFYKPAPNKT